MRKKLIVGNWKMNMLRKEALELAQELSELLGDLNEVDIVIAPPYTSIEIAYEPVWAIGTGKNATPEEAEEVHGLIREILSKIFIGIADKMRILYGGSVTPENIKDLISPPGIDGALVGGASLRAESFAKIVKIIGGIQNWT